MQGPVTSQPQSRHEPFGQTGVRQYLFPVLTVFSLTCMVLSLGMWMRSHYIVDQFLTEREELRWYVSSIYGRILLAWGDDSIYPAPRDEWMYRQYPIPDDIHDRDMWQPSMWKRLGVEWRFEPLDSTWGSRGGWVRVRWPFIAGVWGILPLVRVLREQQHKKATERIRRGQCPRCGYDVRATPSQCPECGTVLVEVRA